ncbi:glutaredoxin family protein [Undibacterium sp. TJN19]|uniref:glutaredoxin family protein n=1 Tax=Undibacterium sp. TJN19 TaxID=3413055 RepID=UPI003BF24E71
MKKTKTMFTYASIIAAGLLIGYVVPRVPMLFKADYAEGNYASHFPDAKTHVVMYSTANCSFCKKTRAYFAENKVDYIDLDVEKSAVAASRHAALGGEGVPVIIIGNRLIRGYQPEVFSQALLAMHKLQTAAQ